MFLYSTPSLLKGWAQIRLRLVSSGLGFPPEDRGRDQEVHGDFKVCVVMARKRMLGCGSVLVLADDEAVIMIVGI